MSDGEVCGYPREGKAPCESPIGLCETCGHCLSHCEHREEERREARSLGGQTTAKRYHRPDGLLPEELPPLESHADAQRWLDRVGRAVATGRIDNRDANSVVRAVEAWIKAEAERLGADAVHELRERLETLEADVGGTVRGIS